MSITHKVEAFELARFSRKEALICTGKIDIAVLFVMNKGSYMRGQFILNLRNEPLASFINFI